MKYMFKAVILVTGIFSNFQNSLANTDANWVCLTQVKGVKYTGYGNKEIEAKWDALRPCDKANAKNPVAYSYCRINLRCTTY